MSNASPIYEEPKTAVSPATLHEGSLGQAMRVIGNLTIPSKPGDVGYNLFSNEDMVIQPGSYARIRTGIRVQMPEGVWGLIVARSSANSSGALVVLPGVIDNGYRGQLDVMVHHVKSSFMRRVWNWFRRHDESISVKSGQALAQLVLLPMITPNIVQVEELDPSVRGESAYGSTGNGVSSVYRRG